MILREIKGELVRLKADGTISNQMVNDKARLKYYGFEFPWSDKGSVMILKGNPKTDTKISKIY
ncbi:MAG: hypothetical protein AB1742_14005 [bacterium]